MSRQREHGQPANIWKTTLVIDNRGNSTKAATSVGPHPVTAAFIPQRSARAEVPGQQIIEVVKMIVAADLVDVELWSRVEWKGAFWDVVSPPQYHHGTRHVRHWSIDIRRRPSVG